MPKQIKSSVSPANDALQHYFDDLVAPIPLHLPSTAHEDRVALKVDEQDRDAQISQKLSQAEKLLAKANFIDRDLPISNEISLANIPTSANDSVQEYDKCPSVDKEKFTNADNTMSSFENSGQIRSVSISLRNSLATKFSVLLCDIANVTVAIPLVELGGIHKLSKLSSIAKQPAWCMGVLLKGNEKFICIDASHWLAPKQSTCSGKESNYTFAVQLGKTPYLLCCDNISTTVEICSDDVRWRNNPTSRGWLAGLLKQRMCALIDGAQMLQEVLA